MNAASKPTKGYAVVLAVAFVAVASGFALWRPVAFAAGYRFAVLAALAPAFGSLLFVLMHRASGGEWGINLARYLRPGVRATPWIWVAGLPMLFIPHSVHTQPRGYESLPAFALRWCVIAAILFIFCRLVLTARPAKLIARDNDRSWLGPVGLIVMVFSFTLVGDDWIESPHPGWHSTAMALVWMAGQCAGGLALAVFLAIRSGSRPAQVGVVGRDYGNDWGNLLMASLIFWAYVSYGEFIVVWSGNKPDEISWFLTREVSGWFYVMPLLFVGNFIVPFLLLLSRRFKRNATGMKRLCIALVAGQVLYIAWLVLPETPALDGPALLMDLLLATLALGLLGVGYRHWLTQREGTA